MFKKTLILLCLILLLLPTLSARTYSSGLYGSGPYGAIDVDNDLIADNIDNLLYNATYVTTSGVTKLNITVGRNHAHSSFNNTQEVLVYDQTDLMINFSHNFTANKLNLSVVEIQKTATYIIVNLSGQMQGNKTLYLEDNSFTALCVKNKEISSITEMSSGCNGDNETSFTTCLGNSAGVRLNGINCTDEGTTIKVENLRYSAIRGTVSSVTPPPPPGDGPGGGGTPPECLKNIDCKAYHYCFDNECHVYECFSDDVCEETETCWNGRCVKLFDIEILDFESPILLGEFFSFAYSIKGMADFDSDVEITFQIEKDAEVISSGKDTIYLGSFQEKTKTSKLFLPTDLISGQYTFSITVSYEHYKVESHRTIEIQIKQGIATLGLLPEAEKRHILLIISLSILSILLLFFIIYLQRRKIKSTFIQEERWIKKHKVPILTCFLFIILGILAYFSGLFTLLINKISLITWSSTLSYICYGLGIIIVLIALIATIKKLKEKIKIPKRKIRRVKVHHEKVKKMKIPRKKINPPKIRPALIKLGTWIIEYKKTFGIILLLIIFGILAYLIYYFKAYEIVVRWALSFANWISSIPWGIVLRYICYGIGAILSLALLIALIILAKKIKKKRKIPKIKIHIPKRRISFPERKIKSICINLGRWIIKHKIPVIISFLVILLGLLIYYFKIYEIVVRWVLSFVNWISSIPWSSILPYIYYTVGAILGLAVLIGLIIVARKLKKKIRIPKRKIQRVKVQPEKIQKISFPKVNIKIPKSKINKIKSIFKKLWRGIIKHKIPVIISCLVVISGLLFYYFKVYEIVVGWALSFASWVSSIPWSIVLPYVYYSIGGILVLGILIFLIILASKLPKSKINKIKSIFKKLGRWIIKRKLPVIIFFLVIISGLLFYYFKVYEIVVGWALALASWVSSLWAIILPYLSYGIGTILALTIVIILIICAKKIKHKMKIPKSKIRKKKKS